MNMEKKCLLPIYLHLTVILLLIYKKVLWSIQKKLTFAKLRYLGGNYAFAFKTDSLWKTWGINVNRSPKNYPLSTPSSLNIRKSVGGFFRFCCFYKIKRKMTCKCLQCHLARNDNIQYWIGGNMHATIWFARKHISRPVESRKYSISWFLHWLNGQKAQQFRINHFHQFAKFANRWYVINSFSLLLLYD